MTLGEILTGARLKSPLSPVLSQLEIQGLEYDSRRVQPGYLFFAFPGSRADGREFARDAVERGRRGGGLANLPRPKGSPRPGLKSSMAGRRWRWPRAISIAARTSASH